MAAEKSRYWSAILYPESMPSDWEDLLPDLFQIPCAYCIHDKDKDGHDGDRKVHVHVLLAFNNTTTYNHALSVVRQLMASCGTVKKVINVRFYFDYLIHDTENSRKKGKFLYNVNERILINNFDIGAYEQRSLQEKQQDAYDLEDYIYKNEIENFLDLNIALTSDPDIDEDLFQRYREVRLSYSGFLSNACKGVYLHKEKLLRDKIVDRRKK